MPLRDHFRPPLDHQRHSLRFHAIRRGFPAWHGKIFHPGAGL
jgi:hypothetical protein